MSASTAAVGTLSGGGVGFPVAAAVGVSLLVAALALAVQALRRPRALSVAGGCLAGGVAVCAQLVLTAGDPTSRAGYLLGLSGASVWYGVGVQLLGNRVTGVGRQWLAVGSLLWVGGTVTVTASAAPADWPLVWSLLPGLGLLAVTAGLGLVDGDRSMGWNTETLELFVRVAGVLGGALLAPGTLGLFAGEEVLFVTYLLVFAVTIVCWSLARLALGG
jgi:hypothetical protein